MKSGWISVYRKIEEKGWYKKSEYVHLWIHLLLRANHKKKNMFINGQEVTIKPGSFITSRAQLALETKLHPSKIERIIKCFKIEQQIEQQNFNTCRLISIVNYEKYQDSEQQNKHKSNSKRTASEQQANTNNNVNNDNTENKKIIKTFLSDSNEIRLSEFLFSQIINRNPKFKKPNFQDWAKHIDFLIRLDNQIPENIGKVIFWCQADDFWQNNILSTSKLRKQFDQLYMKMNNDNFKQKEKTKIGGMDALKRFMNKRGIKF